MVGDSANVGANFKFAKNLCTGLILCSTIAEAALSESVEGATTQSEDKKRSHKKSKTRSMYQTDKTRQSKCLSLLNFQ
jgi:hypothetical protein